VEGFPAGRFTTLVIAHDRVVTVTLTGGNRAEAAIGAAR